MDGKKFMLEVTSSGAAKLRETVKTKLSEFIGEDTDDVLVEYVIVLIGHGKQKSQAVSDLEAFLGSESEAFVTWLWAHLSDNKQLYMDTEDDKPSDMDFTEETPELQIEPSLRSVVSVLEDNEESATVVEPKQMGTPTAVEVGNSAQDQTQVEDESHTNQEAEHHIRRGRRREGSRQSEIKRSRSPEIWTRRGRGRADRPDVKEMSPPDVKASRRLLITAVRDAVAESALLATKKDALRRTESAKRLQSVVSTDADVQENGGHDIAMAHGDASIVEGELPAPGEEIPITTTSVSQERRIQERHPSVWDRLGLTEANQQNSDQVTNRSIKSVEDLEEADQGGWLEPVNPNVDRINGRDRWRRNPDRHRNGHMIGPGKVNGSREHSQNGARQGPGRKFDGNGLLLEDALRKVSLGQNRYQNPMYRTRDAVSRKRLGIQLEHKLSQADEEEGADGQLAYSPEDVSDMKKRLRQVQLEMTKLRARQAEVTKEVQKAPVSGVKPLLFQPSQEDINTRSIFVSNVHFAATKAALAVHFGHCGDINRITLLVDAATGKPKGSAYVEFSTRDAVENALTLNESTLLSRSLKVMRKDDAVAEMITPPVLIPVQYHRPPPIQRSFPREFTLRGALYPVRRSAPPMPYSGKSNLKWKRESSTATGFQRGVHSTAVREMLDQDPVKSTRSLSYVRVAPYAIQGTRGSVQKT